MPDKPKRSRQPQVLQLPSGYRILVRQLGEGPAVVFLHGLMGDHRHWLGVMQKLSRHYRCVGIDLLGFGGSSQPEIEYSIGLEVEFVREAIAALALSNFVLVGHSLGGWVATLFALRYPEQVLGLGLVAPAGISGGTGRDLRLRLLMQEIPLLDWTLGVLAVTAQRFKWKSITQTIKVWGLERQALLNQSVTRQWVKRRSHKASLFPSEFVEDCLGDIQVPTLVMAADRDDVIPLWQCEMFGDRIPSAQLIVLPDTTHRLPIDHWRKLLPHLQSFLHKIYCN